MSSQSEGDAQRAELLFQAILLLNDERERVAFLEKETAGNPSLRRIVVERWVKQKDKPASKMVRALSPNEKKEDSKIGPGSGPDGKYIAGGKYILVDPIGQGGMGSVFLAKQTRPLQRLVAIKFIRPDAEFQSTDQRFDSEWRAMSLMEHPNIATVFDVGTTEKNHAYFVMEYFPGKPITKFCDQRQFNVQQRLELFLSVCRAIQHAHDKGIIHRDIKPSNVLVNMLNDSPVAKVIDFGLAKSLSSRLLDRKRLTQAGSVLGTLEYMSPEQAGPNPELVDERSDVFSLGMLLYELISGVNPLDTKIQPNSKTGEILKAIIREVPPPPSHVLSKMKYLGEIPNQRNCKSSTLIRYIQGDLDSIIMKALERDPNRRYQTPLALARDIQHYLRGEPVEALENNVVYLFKHQVNKNLPWVIAGTWMAALVLLFFLALAMGWIHLGRP